MRTSSRDLLILAIDIGTSSARTSLFDNRARRLSKTTFSQKYRVNYGADGRAELDPGDLLRAVSQSRTWTIRAHASLSGGKAGLPIKVVSGSAFWHALLGLDRDLKPVTPVYTWADSRAVNHARQLRNEFDEHRIQQRTGCMLRATFWPAKMRWLRESETRLFRSVRYWVSPVDWIFYRMFGDLRSSASMASGTGLYNLEQNQWDPELVQACGIEVNSLPPIAARLQSIKRRPHLPDTVFCSIGDGAASNLGAGADRPDVAAMNVGTSAAVRAIEPRTLSPAEMIPAGLFRYVVDEKNWVIGGATSNAGNLRQWCLRELRLPSGAPATDKMLDRNKAAGDSVTVLPFWVEERAPSWPEGQAGVIHGLTQSITAGDLARAGATAVFYRLGQILAQLEKSLGQMQRVIVSGGILHSNASVKLLADALGRDLEISPEPEASLRGAAVYALRQMGLKTPSLKRGKIAKHNRKLASQHRIRQERQIWLEKIMTGFGH